MAISKFCPSYLSLKSRDVWVESEILGIILGGSVGYAPAPFSAVGDAFVQTEVPGRQIVRST